MTKEQARERIESWLKDDDFMRVILPEDVEALKVAISALKVFEGKTNGEVFEAVFPHLFLDFLVEGSVFIKTDDTFHLVDLVGNFERDFWDAPYKGVSEWQ